MQLHSERRAAPADSDDRPISLSSLGRLVSGQGLLVVILAFGLLLHLLSADFLTPANLVNLLYQSTILGVFAIGMTFVILTSGIDLSVGATAGLTSVLSMGAVVRYGWPPILGILVGLAVGLVVGRSMVRWSPSWASPP